MTSVITFEAEKREQKGKGPARALRRAGKIPAIIYGAGKEEVPVAINLREITLQYQKAQLFSRLVDLTVGSDKFRVIPRSVQLHPVTDAIEHVDFMYVNADTEVKVNVPLHYVNEEKSLGLKRGGLLNIVKRNVTLLCHPDAIPSSIEIDCISLNIGDSIRIQDIALPEGTKPAVQDNYTLASIAGRGGKTEKEEGAAA